MTSPDLNAPLLLDRYRPDSLIARGGSSSVYQAHDILLGRAVAVKVFFAGADSSLDRAREELRVLAALAHHGIVSVLDAGIDESTPDDPRPFLVMELVVGRTVRQLIDADELSPVVIGGMAFEVAEALEFVHRNNIVHRDVSPANILMVDYGSEHSRLRARLTDFGLAVHGGWIPSDDGRVNGTIPYLSPEQVRREPLTSASDIYSLGLVLIECFSRAPVFPGGTVDAALARVGVEPAMPPAVPKPWRSLLASMVRQDSASRPTAVDVLGEVRSILREHAS